jgi:hypothetical protein
LSVLLTAFSLIFNLAQTRSDIAVWSKTGKLFLIFSLSSWKKEWTSLTDLVFCKFLLVLMQEIKKNTWLQCSRMA